MADKHRLKCKQCGEISQSGHKFCNKKCRRAWVKERPYRKPKGDYLLEYSITGRGTVSSEDGADEHCIM